MIKYRTRLFYKDLSQVVDGNGMAVITLTDQGEKRALIVVCDNMMKDQMQLRTVETSSCKKLLPEVMASVLHDLVGIGRFEIEIYGIVDGEYQTVLTDVLDQTQFPIRLSDAVLLSRVGDIPIYIANELMLRQSVAYDRRPDGRMAIPINVLSKKRLEEELDKAVASENYRLASQIKDELNRRQDSNKDKQ